MSDWIHGETGGYLRHSTETRNWFETDFPQFLEEAGEAARPDQALQRARQPHHRGAGDRPRLSRPLQRQEQRHDHQPAAGRHHRDRRASSTASASTWSPASRCRKPAPRPACPRSTSSACRSHAAIIGDIDLLKLAVLHDPLVGAICTPEEVWQMVDEMVVAQAAWLPQYAACDSGRQGAAVEIDGQDARLGRGRAPRTSARSRNLRAEKARAEAGRLKASCGLQRRISGRQSAAAKSMLNPRRSGAALQARRNKREETMRTFTHHWLLPPDWR